MQSLFTIHAGEYLVGSHIEQKSAHGRPEYRDKLLSCGWWTLNREKIRESSADYWVFVLHTHDKKDMQYVILTPQQLLERLEAIRPDVKSGMSYIRVTKDNGAGQQCWETRGLKKAQTDALVRGEESIAPERGFSGFLNDWGVIFGEWK